MTQLRVGPAVAWLPWSGAAFERAREERKPVLLSVSAAWSAACREMDRQCYDDRAIAAEINRWFIPVRVDADRRPDIAERYDLGGLPTTAFLTSEGALLGGGTFVPPARLMDALHQVRQATPPHSSPRLTSVDDFPPRDLSPEELVEGVFASFDPVHAGFGTAPKFPLVAPVRLALDLFRESQSDQMADYATRTLDAMAWNGLYDEDGGGFWRCAANADWQAPQPEKLLSTNAALLNLFLEAGVTLGQQRWLGRAADVLEFVQSALSGAPGEGWRLSQENDGARMSDSNAQMASAALHASRVFEDDEMRQLALQSLETVVLANYRPGAGLAHCAGGVRGLLTDHVAMAAAHLDAWDLTADVVYQMMAQELVQFMLRTMWDGAAFVDRSPSDDDLGLLAEPLKPFVLNCEAAEVLHRLAVATGDPEYDRVASLALESARVRAADHGPLAAHYLLALRALSR